MEVLRIVHCSVMIGCGPRFDEKQIEVFLDDVEDGLDEAFIRDMVVAEAKWQLRQRGYTRYTIKEIDSA